MTQLQPLYKTTKTGATQVCLISYEGDQFTVEFGQLDGKRQSKSTTCYDTNLGRSNHRNPTQQAEFEAYAKHKKKVDTGYRTELPSDVPVSADVVLLPQKVKVYQDQLHNIADLVYLSDKLDGVNGTYRYIDNVLSLTSRGGLPYPEIPHITPGIISIMQTCSLDELNLELYIPDTHLQLIQSAVKKPKPLSTQLQARIFELPNYPGNYTAHKAKLDTIADTLLPSHISIVQSDLVSKDRIDEYYNDAVSRGCEGLIIRNPNGIYKHNERSSNVFKYKKAIDAEFLIVNYALDKDSYPKLICNSAGGEFTVRPKGDRESRMAMLANIDDYIGKWYTVEFETYSLGKDGKGGKPLKPVGVGLRECTAEGVPIE